MGQPLLLHADDVHKTFQLGAERLHVLRGAGLSAQAGEFLAIMGASGSGKSTLLHILGALDVPDRGRVAIEGGDVFAKSERERDLLRCRVVGFVFQFYHLLPELTLLENVLLPCMVDVSIGAWASRRNEARGRAERVIEEVGLSHRLRHRPRELSGGERQRAAIARAMVNRPKLLLADEPTGNLDAKTGKDILEVLSRLNAEGQTIILVTHDQQTASFANRVCQLEDGRIQPC